MAASYLVLAVAHADDRYRVDFVSGTWMALADYALDGTLEPPAFTDGSYGGTRYMPLPVLFDAAAARATGDLLVGSKLATYLGALALLVVAFAVLKQVGTPTLLSAALLAAVLATPTGLLATLGIRNDTFAVIFQLGALALVLKGQRTGLLVSAGILSTLAVISKISAVWAPIAIGVWLLRTRRQALVPFVGAFAASLAVAVIAFEALSGGRFLSNVIEFTFVESRGPFGVIAEGPRTVLSKFATYADAVWLLFPIALVAVAVRLRGRKPTLLQIALLADVVVLIVVMSARGTDFNHLIDLCVLTVLVVGEFVAKPVAEPQRQLVALVVAVGVLWGVVSSYQRMMGSETVGALRLVLQKSASETNQAFERNPLAGLVQPNDTILSEDPTIPLLLDQRPVLLDAFTARKSFAEHPERARALAARVAAGEFDKIILVSALSPGSSGYERQFLGSTVNDEVAANYRSIYAEVNLYVYVPNDQR